MGRRYVKATDALIVQVLTTGNEIRQCRVTDGLPEGATLVACHYDGRDVVALFENEMWLPTPAGEKDETIPVWIGEYNQQGDYSLWSCNGCDWRGYLKDTVTPKHNEGHNLCPECNETIAMVTDVDLRRMVEIGLHYTAGLQLSEETKAYLRAAQLDREQDTHAHESA